MVDGEVGVGVCECVGGSKGVFGCGVSGVRLVK